MKYYLIAGEASGDLHGSNLMQAISKRDEHAEFRFWGGDRMAAVGGTQVEHFKNTAFMGFWEVIKNLRIILGFIKVCKADILTYQPDVVILIDYPGFNLRIAEFVKSNGFKTVYYISPQIWAWKENRVNSIKKYIDKMLVILPFEKAFYQKHNYNATFVGHPLLDEIAKNTFSTSIQLKEDSEKRIIALLPGSRKQEITKILPEFLKVVPYFPRYQFVIARIADIELSFYENIIGANSVEIVTNQTYQLLNKSYAAIVASGTATLETALFNVPMVVGYKGSWFSYQIGKRLVKIKFIALANLVMDKKIVEELIQTELNEPNLIAALKQITSEPHRTELLTNYTILRRKLGGSGASELAAAEIEALLKSDISIN